MTAYEDGPWWTFEIPALTSPAPRPGGRIVAMGQARTRDDVPTDARDVIELWTETERFDVRVTYA